MGTPRVERPESDEPRRYSPLAGHINGDAQDLAATIGSSQVRGEHFLSALLAMPASGALSALQMMEVDLEALRARVREAIAPAGRKPAKARGFSKMSTEGQKINLFAHKAASRQGASRLETVHMLHGMLSQSETAAKCLHESGVSIERLTEVVSENDLSD